MEANYLRHLLADRGSVVSDGVLVGKRVMKNPATYKAKSSLEHPVASEEVAAWPEYIQFMNRLGIDQNDKIFKTVITIQAGHLVTIEQSYWGVDTSEI